MLYIYPAITHLCTCTYVHGHVHICVDPPEYTASTDPTTVLESKNVSYTFQFAANPAPDSFMWTKNDQTISDGRVTVSVSGLTITGTTRDHSGVYQVNSSNAAGVGSGSFTLNVQCECSSMIAQAASCSDVIIDSLLILSNHHRSSWVCQHPSTPAHSVDGWSCLHSELHTECCQPSCWHCVDRSWWVTCH